jgi:hypothetical protein
MSEYRDKLLTIGVLKGGRSKSQTVTEDEKDGIKRKHTTDAAGNTTTEWAEGNRVDVEIRPKSVDIKLMVQGGE